MPGIANSVTGIDQNWLQASSKVEIKNISFPFQSTVSCSVRAIDNTIVSKVWFSTPALDQKAINTLEAFQLYARACFKRDDQPKLISAAAGGSYSWLDIVILESPTAVEPRVRDGVTLAWLSHANQYNSLPVSPIAGKLFDYEGTTEQQDEKHITQLKTIKAALEPGNALGVRVCAQFPHWQNVADSAHLVVRFDNTKTASPDIELPSVSKEVEIAIALQAAVAEVHDNAVAQQKETAVLDQPNETPAVPNSSRASDLLTAEVRADSLYSRAGLPAYEETLRPLRLLSLDGGGVRGVSELEILSNIMDRVRQAEGREYQVYEYFDMIAGTSTGALLAMMLGRLKMTIAQCKEAYDNISKSVFNRSTNQVGYISPAAEFVNGSYFYGSEPLIKAVKDQVKNRLNDPTGDTLLLDPNNKPDTEACKVLVMTCSATNTQNGNQNVHLRSWVTPAEVPSEYPKIKIWQAARATSAAPGYFERLTCNVNDLVDVQGTVSGTVSFIDGGMVENNPILELMSEAILTYGPKRKVGCIVSIGTGIPAQLEFTTDRLPLQDVVNMLTNSEKAVQQAQNISLYMPASGERKFFRFDLSGSAMGNDKVPGWKEGPFPWSDPTRADVGYTELFAAIDEWRNVDALRQMTDDWLKSTA